MKRIIFAGLIALGLFASAGVATAAVTPAITLDQVAPHFGDTVTFTSSYDPVLDRGHDEVLVMVSCAQNGIFIWTDAAAPTAAATTGIALGAPGHDDSSLYSWTSGPASCVVRLLWYHKSVSTIIASTPFDVAG